MMKNRLVCFVFVFAACNTVDKTNQQESTEKITMDSVNTAPATTDKTVITESGSNCVRDVPVSILKKNAFPNMSFEMQPNKQIGIETINLDNGDKVIIKNWGCDYYALTFRFETSRFESEINNTGFWYKRSVTLLNEIAPHLNAPIDISKGTERIIDRIEEEVPNGYQNLVFNKELDFEEGSIRSFVSIDKVEQISDKKFAIEITFAKGPL